MALNSGGISKRCYAQELKQSSDKTEIFSNITDEFIESLPDEAQDESELAGGLFGEESGEPNLTPASAPQKVLREEGKAKAADADGPGEVRHVGAFDVIVETARGGVRRGRDWETIMPADYGYIVGYRGADGDSVDCYVGPAADSDAVYVVDQMRLDKPRRFDEHKILFGYRTRNEALDAYMSGHHASSKVFGAITPMTMDGLKDWLRTADLRKPCSSGVRA